MMDLSLKDKPDSGLQLPKPVENTTDHIPPAKVRSASEELMDSKSPSQKFWQ
ncbi:hypothetical protein KIN20_015628 [Parelaphostrongylus tenuis]|uniref:Uncharacterized protein n=1 Tax=Parelaphostrongylus tenuis TaxID=148309 RepID=A0AAD5MJW5_PARTN|nr:hypothetical protein KIN20_015628 [Parelaphostrongylus tenuis]